MSLRIEPSDAVDAEAVGALLVATSDGTQVPLSISAAVGFIAVSGVAVLGDMVLASTIRRTSTPASRCGQRSGPRRRSGCARC